MGAKRTDKLNALLQEVIAEVILREVKNPHLTSLLSIMKVEVTKDLHHAKVHVSIMGTPEEKKKSFEALCSAAGFIAVHASKKVVLRHFPELHFHLDDSVAKQMRIDTLLRQIEQERDARHSSY